MFNDMQLANGGFKIYPSFISNNKKSRKFEKIKYKMSQKLLKEEKYDSSIIRTAEEFFRPGEKDYKKLF